MTGLYLPWVLPLGPTSLGNHYLGMGSTWPLWVSTRCTSTISSCFPEIRTLQHLASHWKQILFWRQGCFKICFEDWSCDRQNIFPTDGPPNQPTDSQTDKLTDQQTTDKQTNKPRPRCLTFVLQLWNILTYSYFASIKIIKIVFREVSWLNEKS